MRWAVAMDVDGTILTDDYAVLPEVRHEVQKARSRGVLAILVTARPRRSAIHILEDIGGVDVAICLGGALTLEFDQGVQATGLIQDDQIISANHSAALIADARTSGVALAMYGEDGVYVDRLTPVLADQFRKTGLTCVEGDLLAVTDPTLKFLLIGDRGTLPAVERIRGRFDSELSCLYSHWNFLEISRKSVSKGIALERFCRARGISPEGLAAIGDSDNDLSMFAFAGMPIAMGNAPDHVKQAARWVTASNGEAGVAVALRHCAETFWRAG